ICPPNTTGTWLIGSSPSPIPLISATTTTVTVTNTLTCKENGYLLVSKSIDNQTNDHSGAYLTALNALVFPVTATCDGSPTALSVTPVTQAIVHAVPVGQHCSVVEG